MRNPCVVCGACCAHFRVAFHWSEADASLGGCVPPELTETLDPHRLNLRGTQSRTPRCVALAGTIGEAVSCTIYPQRPSPCRELQAAWRDGVPSPQCDLARQAHDLAPLTPEDWAPPAPITCGCSN